MGLKVNVSRMWLQSGQRAEQALFEEAVFSNEGLVTNAALNYTVIRQKICTQFPV